MKTIRVILVIAVAVVSVFSFSPTQLNAAQANYTCTVLEAGPTPRYSTAKYRFRLTDDGGVFTGAYFKPETGYEKDMLAVMLTAMANGKKVKIRTDYVAGTTPTIVELYLLNN